MANKYREYWYYKHVDFSLQEREQTKEGPHQVAVYQE